MDHRASHRRLRHRTGRRLEAPRPHRGHIAGTRERPMVGYAYRRDVGVPEDELGTCAECIVDPNRHASADLVPRGIGAQGGQDRMHIDISVKWRPRGSERDAQVRRMPDLGARLVRVLEAAPHRCRREAFRVAPRPIFPLDPPIPSSAETTSRAPTTRERSRVTRLRTGTATSPRNGARRRSPDGISGGLKVRECERFVARLGAISPLVCEPGDDAGDRCDA